MLINGVKFACATCIKGHRSSNCNHLERPLFEIRKKGRPVTQCAYCRDLRKTKQIHIKCVCGDKSKAQWSSQKQQQCQELSSANCQRCSANSKKSNGVCTERQEIVMMNSTQQQQQQSMPQAAGCTCPEKTRMRSLSLSAGRDSKPVNPDSSDVNVYKDAQRYIDTSSFGCPISPQPSLSDPAYSWAVVSPQSSSAAMRRNETMNLGFVFQKPHGTVPRFFDGQPKSPRRRPTSSTRRQQQQQQQQRPYSRSPCSTSSGYLSDPCLSATTTSTSSMPMLPSSSDMGFPLSKEDDPLQSFDGQLHPSISEADQAVAAAAAAAEDEALVRDLALTHPDELTALLNQVLTHEDNSKSSMQGLPSLSLPPSTSSSTSTSSAILSAATPARPPTDYCGSFACHSACRPSISHDQGESVVITITPLPKSGQEDPTSRMTTRIVTCYCGPTCTCPGCFVHPGNFFLGNSTLDPYAGLFSAQRACSSTSSSYSSDDDDRRL
ncbi:hypothetical protein EC973_003012 [Apophysomyces ossiformis]|uniref:Copper-fist domain-containing protein n=1 Tax=Apophysomyces ossiformis TaxID=679940 RepID=A0A8H7ESY3_9FUNG|nr:hypothetical protein EC973_003012 [Apophysomyces ossiformis]